VSRQSSLFGFSKGGAVIEEVAPKLKVLTWNIVNPSIDRAYNQFSWLTNLKANIIILTEAKQSKGCTYLRNALEGAGYKVYSQAPQDNDYCVMIAEKGLSSSKWPIELSSLSHRLELIVLKTSFGELKVIGMYVPSRWPKEKRNINKRLFQNQVISLLKSLYKDESTKNLTIGGDLNVIDPTHVPKYPIFGDWEFEFYNAFLRVGLIDVYKLLNPTTQDYRWFGKLNDGYRFDHLFISKCFDISTMECYYLHEPRVSKLSDHSAMLLILKP